MIAALNGNCIGGGLEMAKICSYRVAAASIPLGLPGGEAQHRSRWGGALRLPRLARVAKAAAMCAQEMRFARRKRSSVESSIALSRIILGAIS